MVIKTVTDEKEAACQELKEAIGARKVRDDEITLVTHGRICHGFDPMWGVYQKPSMVVFPETREDVVETLRIANKYKIGVTPIGTAQMRLQTTEGDIILDQRRRNRIIEINTDSGYAIMEPGVTHDQLTAALRGTGFKAEVGTMTGSATVLAGGLGKGSKSFTNRLPSSILDLEVVLPDGTIFNTGSMIYGVSPHYARGPFSDLAGLYYGAAGMLGVVTKFAVRIHPVNEVSKVHLAGFDNFSDAVDYVKDIVNNNIPEHCIIWNWHMYVTWPLDAEGMETFMPEILKSDIRKPPEGTPYSMVSTFLSSYKELVEAYEKTCAKVAEKYHGRAYTQEEVAKRWPQTVAGFKQQYEDYSYREATHWAKGRFSGFLVHAEPKNIKEVEKIAVEEFAKFGPTANPINNYSHPVDNGRTFLFRFAARPDFYDSELREKIGKKSMELCREALKKYGAVSMMGAEDMEGVKAYMSVIARIKKALDPNNILSRASGAGLSVEGE